MLLITAGVMRPVAEPRDGAEVLEKVCARCHWGPKGGDEGGFSEVLDRDALISGDYLVPGEPKKTQLLERVEKNEMPPDEALAKFSPAQRRAYRVRLAGLLRAWVQQGAPMATAKPVRWVGPLEVEKLALDDVRSLPYEEQADARYFSLAESARAGASREELELLRAALAKALSSLSWRPWLAELHPVGDEGVLYRVSLERLGWQRDAWESTLFEAYPFAVRRDSVDAVRLQEATRSRQPMLRADFLVAEGTRPALYHALLRLPANAQSLESLLSVSVADDVREGRVLRAGFNGSGVSQNNRLLERHDARHGAYWRSYDFQSSTGDENLFAHPLGPCGDEGFDCPRAPFRPAGGEYIFTLPNGMLGFFLSDGRGRRLERAPTAIVRDPKRPDGAVENGQSCLGCHARGFFYKADQVRPAVAHSRLLTWGERAEVERLYAEPLRLQAQVERDNVSFLKALEKLGVDEGVEPVTAVAEAYRGELSLKRAAAELGLYPEELKAQLAGGGSRFASLSALANEGGTVKRDAFAAAFPDLVRQLRLGEPTVLRPHEQLARAVCGQSGTVEERVEDCALVFSAPRGRGETESRRSGFSLVVRGPGGQEVWREESTQTLFVLLSMAQSQQSALDACAFRVGAGDETGKLGGRWSLPLAGELEHALVGGLPARDGFFWSQDVDESHKVNVDGVLVSAHGRRTADRNQRFAAVCVKR